MFVADWMTSPHSPRLLGAWNINHPIQVLFTITFTSHACIFCFCRCAWCGSPQTPCTSVLQLQLPNQQWANTHAAFYHVLSTLWRGPYPHRTKTWLLLSWSSMSKRKVSRKVTNCWGEHDKRNLKTFLCGIEKGLAITQRVLKGFTEEITFGLDLNCL